MSDGDVRPFQPHGQHGEESRAVLVPLLLQAHEGEVSDGLNRQQVSNKEEEVVFFFHQIIKLWGVADQDVVGIYPQG